MRWIHGLNELGLVEWDGGPLGWVAEPGNEPQPANVSEGDVEDTVRLGPEHGARRLQSRFLLRLLAARALNVHPDHIRMVRQSGGGICIEAPSHLWASCARSDGRTVVAIARQRIGVDIESRPLNSPPPFALLHPEERELLLALSGTARDSMFLRFWTTREAYLKAIESGIDGPISRVRSRALHGSAAGMMIEGDIAAAVECLEASNYVATAVWLSLDQFQANSLR